MDNHEELGQHIEVLNFDIEKKQQKKNKEHKKEKVQKFSKTDSAPNKCHH